MDEMIQAIAEAETKAGEIRQAALDEAAKIVEDARASARKTEEDAVTARRQYGTEATEKVVVAAKKGYDDATEKARGDADAFVRSLKKEIEIEAGLAAGRIVGGNR